MMSLTQVQSVFKAYKQSPAIERAKPVNGSDHLEQRNSKSFHENSKKSFSQILHEEMSKKK